MNVVYEDVRRMQNGEDRQGAGGSWPQNNRALPQNDVGGKMTNLGNNNPSMGFEAQGQPIPKAETPILDQNRRGE